MSDRRAHHAAISEAYALHRQRMYRALRRRYASACEGLLEDALQATFETAIGRPAAFVRALESGDARALERLLVLAAIRMARQALRRMDARHDGWSEDDGAPGLHTAEHPEDVLAASQTAARIEIVVTEAANRHGGGKRERVLEALRWRLVHGRRDLEAARRFNVPREYVQRARRFVEDEILAA